MVEVFIIKNNPDGSPLYKFLMSNMKSIAINMNMPVTPAPLPEETSAENVLVKIEGNSTDVSYSWTIKDYTTDQEVLAGIPTKTITQQISFFRTLLSATSIEDSYTFQIEYPVEAQVFNGILTGIKLNTSGKDLLTYTGRITFLEGTAIAIYDIDTPSQPQNFVVSSPSSGQLKGDWTAPIDPGSNPIIGYIFEYALVGSSNFIQVDVGLVLTHTVAGLSTGTYNARVKAYSNMGAGRPSALLEQDVA